jgi:hypothetical protein
VVDTLGLTLKEDNTKTSSIYSYPNPFNSALNIKGTSGTKIYLLTNVYGQVIRSGKILAQQDLSHLTSGIYFMTMIKDPSWQTIKLIKEKRKVAHQICN